MLPREGNGVEMVRRGACRRAGMRLRTVRCAIKRREAWGCHCEGYFCVGSMEAERMDVVIVESRNGKSPDFVIRSRAAFNYKPHFGYDNLPLPVIRKL